MLDFIKDHWTNILLAVSLITAPVAIIHAATTKDEVRSAIGWVGVIILSPILGALVYAIAGINRIRRASITSERSRSQTPAVSTRFKVPGDLITERFGAPFDALNILGDRVAGYPMTMGNTIAILETGDDAYVAMLEAIGSARRSLLLETYIFDRDSIGERIADALIEATRRGVCVRVLIDAVGARYSVPSIVGYLRAGEVHVDVFNGNIIMGLRLPYANLRTHRKILVIDGSVAFTGGMNIREGFTSEFANQERIGDTHFRVTGPIVADLFSIAAEDWRFTTGEMLNATAWHIETPADLQSNSTVLMRAVASGPDASVETNHKVLMGAFSVAQRSIRIMSPYFLPDRELISALTTAARRGIEVDIVVPSANNLVLVDHAMWAQYDQVLKNYCRIWRATGSFDHSKLLTVDGVWAYIGSSNMDPRSLRLNFEVDIEVLDTGFAGTIDRRIGSAIASAVPVTLAGLRARPAATRLIDRILWLGSPYL